MDVSEIDFAKTEIRIRLCRRTTKTNEISNTKLFQTVLIWRRLDRTKEDKEKSRQRELTNKDKEKFRQAAYLSPSHGPTCLTAYLRIGSREALTVLVRGSFQWLLTLYKFLLRISSDTPFSFLGHVQHNSVLRTSPFSYLPLLPYCMPLNYATKFMKFFEVDLQQKKFTCKNIRNENVYQVRIVWEPDN